MWCTVSDADAPAASSTERDHCSADMCRYGAVCEVKAGKAYCVCPYDCTSSDGGPAVCGTDGRRHKSLCHLILQACRSQRLIRPAMADRC